MKLSKMKKEELELYSYLELSKMILAEEKKPLTTPDMFKKICDLLDFSDEDYTEKIGDYYTSLTTDKEFVFLEDGTWDLRDRHPSSVILEEDEEEETEEETQLNEEELIDENIDDDMDLDEEDDTDQLTIIDEEELEE